MVRFEWREQVGNRNIVEYGSSGDGDRIEDFIPAYHNNNKCVRFLLCLLQMLGAQPDPHCLPAIDVARGGAHDESHADESSD